MKNKLIKSGIYVILLGLIAKILSMIVKIYTTRVFGIELMSIYSLINPLIIFIITSIYRNKYLLHINFNYISNVNIIYQ